MQEFISETRLLAEKKINIGMSLERILLDRIMCGRVSDYQMKTSGGTY